VRVETVDLLLQYWTALQKASAFDAGLISAECQHQHVACFTVREVMFHEAR
jgi:hypothetical protein